MSLQNTTKIYCFPYVAMKNSKGELNLISKIWRTKILEVYIIIIIPEGEGAVLSPISQEVRELLFPSPERDAGERGCVRRRGLTWERRVLTRMMKDLLPSFGSSS